MSICSPAISPMQRRTVRGFAALLLFLAAFSSLAHAFADEHRLTVPLTWLLATLAAFAVVAAILLVARYLHREPDEYVRLLVTRSLLVGLAAVMLVNAAFGVIAQIVALRGLVEILNIDVFCVATMVALRLQLRHSS